MCTTCSPVPGFSYNPGGWLVSDAFEYLLGCPKMTDEIREHLWKMRLAGMGYEEALDNL